MVLSVIIVNYRVRYFLELCLHSVRRALVELDGLAEVIVIDNASGDESIEELRPLFPSVRFVMNDENVGFARANNQALRLAGGEYILFLNPDTVLPEDFARSCLQFVRSGSRSGEAVTATERVGSPVGSAADAPVGSAVGSPVDSPLGSSAMGAPAMGSTDGSSVDAPMGSPVGPPAGSGRPADRGMGALGVRMIDGSGRFLPESRRGFPSPWVAFCKMAGLSALFPRSRFFAGYYLGGMPADRAHPAPVLSGACMLVRRAVLEEVGGFDEQFFMYAEDIDLSYRIEAAGYRNYYFPGTTIVHFKGESTQKDSRYVRLFYKAMSQFRRKHFNRGMPALWNWAIEIAIRARAGLGGLGRPGRITVRPRVGKAGIKGRRKVWITGDEMEAERVRDLVLAAGDWEVVSATGEPSASGEASATGEPSAGEEASTSAEPWTGRKASTGAEPSTDGKVPVSTEPPAVLLCEGPAFSFRECINALENGLIGPDPVPDPGPRPRPRHSRNPTDRPEHIVLIHAAGSRSAAGSADRNGRGETLVF